MRRTQLLRPTAIGLVVLFATLVGSSPAVAGPIIRNRYKDHSRDRFGSVIRDRFFDRSATSASAQATQSTSQPKHRPVTLPPAALLVLIVSDDAVVSINGRRMKPQYLAGSHPETRQYLLAGFLTKSEKLRYEVIAYWRDKQGRLLAKRGLKKIIEVRSGETIYQRIDTPVDVNVALSIATKRLTAGLIARYRFDEPDGDDVHDSAPGSNPLDLKIHARSTNDYNWPKSGGLKINGSLIISSDQSAKRLVDRIKKSNAFTIEAWISPQNGANAERPGPARIVSISSNTSNRNVTLGQKDLKYEVRLRTDGKSTDNNGLIKGRKTPLTSPNAAALPELMHVVVTRNSSGTMTLYVNGFKVSSAIVPGKLTDWDDQMHLHLANELGWKKRGANRMWRGTYRYVAVYDWALSREDVQRQSTVRP